MAELNKDTDQSMEDILQSIKRIIADEDEPVASVPGSDVLELTELLAEDVAVPEPSAPQETALEAITLDEIFEEPAAPEAEPEPEAELLVTDEPQHVAEPQPQPEPAVEAHTEDPTPEEKLISDAALAASVEALHALSTGAVHHAPVAGGVFRSGTTVEDLVVEALKPMLKDWLDTNLPAMVRSLVEREIRRLSA